MATRTNKVEVEIVAIDEASPTIDRLEKKIDGLESDEARIVVTANVERLDKQLTDALAKMAKLEGDELTVQARLVGTLEQDLLDARKLFEQLDGKTGTVTFNADSTDFDTARRRIDDIDKSAGSSRSALANMIGNSAQDLGQLGGIAGSTGVLIGQMAEYMADAAFEGERFGNVIRSFAAIAGPAVALATAIGVINSLMVESEAKAQAAQERTKAFGDAMSSAADDSVALTDSLRANTDMLTEFDVQTATFGAQLQENLSAIARGVPLLGGLLGDTGKNLQDLIPIMQAAGFSVHDFAQAIEAGGLVGDEWTHTLLEAVDAGKISEAQYEALSQAIEEYGGNVETAQTIVHALTVDQEEANARLQQLINLRDPLRHFTDQWAILLADIRDGQIDTKESADAINFLSDALGLSTDQILQLVDAEHQQQIERHAAISAAEGYTRAQDLVNASIQQAITDTEGLTAAQRGLKDAYDELLGTLSAEEDRLRLTQEFANVQERLAKGDLTMAEAQLLVVGLQQRLAGFLKENQAKLDLTDQEIVTFVAQLDAGSVQKVEADLRDLERQRNIPVMVEPSWATIGGFQGGGFVLRPEDFPRQPGPTGVGPNVTIINPPGTPAATVGSMDIYVSRNGVRTDQP
jgi:hypothetical protein